MQDSLKVKSTARQDNSLHKYQFSTQPGNLQPGRRTATYDALILDAALRQSLVAVRSLGHRGLRVAALEVSDILEKLKYIPTFSSRWCLQSYIAPEFQYDTGPFITYLLELIEATGVSVLIP